MCFITFRVVWVGRNGGPPTRTAGEGGGSVKEEMRIVLGKETRSEQELINKLLEKFAALFGNLLRYRGLPTYGFDYYASYRTSEFK